MRDRTVELISCCVPNKTKGADGDETQSSALKIILGINRELFFVQNAFLTMVHL